MSVTPDDVAVELGRPASSITPAEQEQWERWIARVYRLIDVRLGLVDLDLEVVDDVVVMAVARRATRPDGEASSITRSVSVDDASMQDTARYGERGDRRENAWILAEWWALLTPAGEGRAFSIDMTPDRPPGLWDRPDLWFQWVTPVPEDAP